MLRHTLAAIAALLLAPQAAPQVGGTFPYGNLNLPVEVRVLVAARVEVRVLSSAPITKHA